MKKMKLLVGIVTLGAIVLMGNQAQAQRGHGRAGGDGNTFEVGSMTLNIGAGAGRSSFGNFGNYGVDYGYGTGIGFKVAAERGIWQIGPGVLSIGAEIGGAFSSGDYYNYKSNIFIIAARAAYHFGFNVHGLDVYAGPSLGPGIRSYDYGDYTNPGTHHDLIIAPGFFAGASYYFTPKFGVNVEAGYDITLIQGGIIFKMN